MSESLYLSQVPTLKQKLFTAILILVFNLLLTYRVSPPFDEDDYRWIGAWWLGLPIIASLLLLFSLLIMLFPRRLPIKDANHTTDASVRAAKELSNRSC